MRHGANSHAELGVVDEKMESGQGRQRGEDNQHRFYRYHQTLAERHRAVEKLQTWVVQIKCIPPQAFKQAQRILQEKRRADGGNQRHQARPAQQRSIGDPFERHRGHAADDHAGRDHQQEHHGGMERAEEARAL